MNVKTLGEAILFIATMAWALGGVRRVPSASPAVLCATVVLGILSIERPGGRFFPIFLLVGIALAWAGVAVARSSRGVALTTALRQRVAPGGASPLRPAGASAVISALGAEDAGVPAARTLRGGVAAEWGNPATGPGQRQRN